MKLPELKKPENYTGLYVFDFGDYTSVGFTAEEVAELLESEKYQHGKVYKIHRAYPNGNLELNGIQNDRFQLEAGMFFYAGDIETARNNFKQLTTLAVTKAPPCRATVHLAKYSDERFVTALIYPAEYDDEISSWLLHGKYKTNGAADGGIQAVQKYYDFKPRIIESQQLFSRSALMHRTGEKLLANIRAAVQR